MKLYRKHRSSLSESLKTTVVVEGLDEIRSIIQKEIPNLDNIQINEQCMNDSRLPLDWGGKCFYVIADSQEYKGICIGFCNFYEK